MELKFNHQGFSLLKKRTQKDNKKVLKELKQKAQEVNAHIVMIRRKEVKVL